MYYTNYKDYKDPIDFLNNNRLQDFNEDGDIYIERDEEGCYVEYDDAIKAVNWAKELSVNELTVYKIILVHGPGVTTEQIVTNEDLCLEMAEKYFNSKIKLVGIILYKCKFVNGVLENSERIKRLSDIKLPESSVEDQEENFNV